MAAKRVLSKSGEPSPKKKPDKKITVEEFYALEDKFAETAGSDVLYDEWKKEAALLREQLEGAVEGKPCSSSVILNVVAMRRIGRLAMFNNKRLKEITASGLQLMETKYLSLQNTSSEIQHLHKEIVRCLEFRSGDEDLELVPVDEFLSTVPDLGENKNEHEMHLARLNWEITQRKVLVGTLAELEGRRAVLVSDINGKEQRLDSLKPKIDNLIRAAKPLQEVLGGVKGGGLGSGGQRTLAAHLSHDLSVLYVQAEAYKDIVKDNLMSVHINGDPVEAAKWAEKQTDDNEEREKEVEGESDTEDAEAFTDVRHAVKSVTKKLEDCKEKIFTPHPVSLQINIGCEGDVTVKMKLCYLPELRSTFLRWKISGKLPKDGGVCNDDVLLEELFPSDTGLECPNPVGRAKLQQLDITLDALSTRLGRPYRFVQSLAGADGPVEGLRLADALQATIQSIRERVHNRIALAMQIKTLESCRILESALSSSEVPSPPSKVETELKAAKVITEEQYLTDVPASSRALSQLEGNSSAFYMITLFEHKKTNSKVTCHVFIGANYPRQPPLLSLSVAHGTEKELTADNTPWVKALERYVNVECLSACDSASLLLHQMSVLCSRIDVALQANPAHDPLKIGAHLMPRSSRGRSGEPPMEFNAETNSFIFL